MVGGHGRNGGRLPRWTCDSAGCKSMDSSSTTMPSGTSHRVVNISRTRSRASSTEIAPWVLLCKFGVACVAKCSVVSSHTSAHTHAHAARERRTERQHVDRETALKACGFQSSSLACARRSLGSRSFANRGAKGTDPTAWRKSSSPTPRMCTKTPFTSCSSPTAASRNFRGLRESDQVGGSRL